MQLEWMLTPIAQYACLALALIACLALFISVKLEIAAVRRSHHQSQASTEAAAAAAAEATAATINALSAELAALRREIEVADATNVTGQELNLTRRAQALRMGRRGESPATIAATLRVPRNEIDLLVKIQDLGSDRDCAQSPLSETEPRP